MNCELGTLWSEAMLVTVGGGFKWKINGVSSNDVWIFFSSMSRNQNEKFWAVIQKQNSQCYCEWYCKFNLKIQHCRDFHVLFFSYSDNVHAILVEHNRRNDTHIKLGNLWSRNVLRIDGVEHTDLDCIQMSCSGLSPGAEATGIRASKCFPPTQ